MVNLADERHRRLLEGRFRDGLPLNELAERAGVTHQAVSFALDRVFDLIRPPVG